MEQLIRLKQRFDLAVEELEDAMEEFEDKPTQANRNEIIRKMAKFCKCKNSYMQCLRDLLLKGDNTKNLKFMKNVR